MTQDLVCKHGGCLWHQHHHTRMGLIGVVQATNRRVKGLGHAEGARGFTQPNLLLYLVTFSQLEPPNRLDTLMLSIGCVHLDQPTSETHAGVANSRQDVVSQPIFGYRYRKARVLTTVLTPGVATNQPGQGPLQAGTRRDAGASLTLVVENTGGAAMARAPPGGLVRGHDHIGGPLHEDFHMGVVIPHGVHRVEQCLGFQKARAAHW